MKDYQIGDILKGTVTGLRDYGIFVKLSNEDQGLIHISECKHGYVTDVSEIVNVGDQVKVQIIDIDEFTHSISLSMRSLKKLNYPMYPARLKRRRKRNVPKIGFASIEDIYPHWIEEAVEIIEKDQYHTKIKV